MLQLAERRYEYAGKLAFRRHTRRVTASSKGMSGDEKIIETGVGAPPEAVQQASAAITQRNGSFLICPVAMRNPKVTKFYRILDEDRREEWHATHDSIL